MKVIAKKSKKSIKAVDVIEAAGDIEIQPQTASQKTVTKTADNKGRIGLGAIFANRSVIIQRLNETEMVIKLARVIPESEAWLYDNAEALAAVRTGRFGG